jgi:hypothetical protein
MLSPPDNDTSRYLDEITEEYDSDELLTAEEETIGEEVAILTWLWTFPQVSDSVEKKVFFRQWAGDDAISRYVSFSLHWRSSKYHDSFSILHVSNY